MKKHNKIRIFLASCLAALATVFCGVLVSATPVKANAEESKTLAATEFKTDGASVRVLKKINGVYESAGERTGIRFHVEMGAGYTVGGTALLDTTDTTTNTNGAYKMVEGYKTYTLVLPTEMLGGNELTLETEEIAKIDTTGYWFSDDDGNWESVAYIYNIPTEKRTQEFTFRGVIVSVDANGNESLVAYTSDSGARHVAYVARRSYDDTLAGNHSWGSMVEEAKTQLLKLIPQYSVSYSYTDENGDAATKTESLMWGDTPNAPSVTIAKEEGDYIDRTAGWYDTTGKETVDVTAAMEYSDNRTLTLELTPSAEFKFTGVADLNNFIEVNGTPYSGTKIYATLPTVDFYSADDITNGTKTMVEVNAKAVEVEYEGTGTFGGLQGVWVMMEGQGGGAQVRLAVAFDSSSFKTDDKLIFKAGSVFYANGVMYKLAADYTIDYTLNGDTEDYGIFLGYLHNSDIAEIDNWIEPTDNTRKRIRVTFKNDLLINSDFTIVYDGTLPTGYEYPVYTSYTNETTSETTIKQVSQGYYYWNEGQHTILELEGYADHSGTKLYGAPGTKIVQNGGYYIFEDAMYAYYNGDVWVVGEEKGTFGADAFETKGSYYTTTVDGKLVKEIRFTTNGNTTLTDKTTTNRWFDAVVQTTVENMSATAPYAVYFTDVNGNVSEVDNFVYHGQAAADRPEGYYHIFAFEDYEGTQAGETITIIEGTRFWVGANYFTATEEIVFYYNGTSWVVGNGEADAKITASNFNGQNYNYPEGGVNKMRMHFLEEYFNGQTGSLYLESGSVKVNDTAYTNLYYHGNGNKIFEIIGGTENEIGQDAFTDTLVIEKGTRLWIGMNIGSTLEPYCLEFDETIEWRYLGKNLRDGSGNVLNYHWVIPNNTDITRADITSVYNTVDSAGGEVRFGLKEGILTNTYYGFTAMDTSKGIPVVNGVEKPNYAFAYDMNNRLIAVRGGEYGTELGDYVVIPAGSMWWTTQGSLTFTEEIFAAWTGDGWEFCFNAEDKLNEVSQANVQKIYNEGSEVRIRIDSGINDTYYGPVAVKGDAYVTKADGTVINSVFSYWYGGASYTVNENWYKADHSLIGIRGTNISNSTNGDVLTLKAGTRIAFKSSLDGYCEIVDDIVYTYVDGTWQAGDLTGTATYSANKATVTGDENVIVGKTYSFTVTPDSGYAVSAVTVNGKPLTLNTNNEYSFTAEKTNDIVVETISTASAYKVSFVVGAGVTLDDGAIADGSEVYVTSGNSLSFKLELAEGYRLVSVDGASDDDGDGTYTLTPTDATTITITTVKQWTVTYTLNQSTASIYGQTVSSGATMTVDEGSYVVTVTANSGYAITSISAGATDATNNLDGTYTVNVNADMNIVVNTMQSIKLGASDITGIQVYDETSVASDNTGIRLVINGSSFASITDHHYGLSWNGSVTATADGGVYHATAFGNGTNLFQLKFATANLKVGDEFKIAKGTVFSGGGNGGVAYAIEWTEDIVGLWTGTAWILNPVKAGDLDWNKVGNVISYSDYVDGAAINYTIRIFLSEELFGGASGQGAAMGNVTVNGSAYTGIWRYHGNGNKIVEVSEWNYAKGDVLVIEAGTKIFLGSSYYVTTNTLTATCSADGSGAEWTWTVS